MRPTITSIPENRVKYQVHDVGNNRKVDHLGLMFPFHESHMYEINIEPKTSDKNCTSVYNINIELQMILKIINYFHQYFYK